MKRTFLGLAVAALLLVAAETASAQPRIGVPHGGGYYHNGGYLSAPAGGVRVSYATPIGNSGYLRVGYSNLSMYPAYSQPLYVQRAYVQPVIYTGPVYYYPAPTFYSSPMYYGYGSPSYGFSYYGGSRRGWRW